MKFRIPLACLLVAFAVNVQAAQVDWQRVSGSRTTGSFGWNYTYEIGFFDHAISVDLDIRLLGDPADAGLLSTWETGIESLWSTERFAVPIVFNVDWVNIDWDQSVTVHAGDGGVNMSNWYTGNPSGWGIAYQDEVAAHESGHMFGFWDEYSGGAVNPVSGLINTGGLMHTLDGPTLDYYYEDFLTWYDSTVVPLPDGGSTAALLGIGVLGLAYVRQRARS